MDIGLPIETEVMCFAQNNGIIVSIPFGGHERYDQIWDINGKLLRVQIKKSSLLDDGSGFQFAGKNTAGKYTADQVDGIATIHDGKCYFIPIDQCSNIIRLRYTIPNNANVKQTKFAYDYELKRILKI